MSEKIRALPIFNKPSKGDPCNNCGYCCHEEACLISETVFGDARTPCSALEAVGDKFYCGLLRSPGKYLPNLANNEELKNEFVALVSSTLGINKGCDAEFDGVSGGCYASPTGETL